MAIMILSPSRWGRKMSIEAVMAPEDYDELYVQVERELRACLRGEPSPVCTRQLSGKGEEGAVLAVGTRLRNRPSLDSVTEEDTLSVGGDIPRWTQGVCSGEVAILARLDGHREHYVGN